MQIAVQTTKADKNVYIESLGFSTDTADVCDPGLTGLTDHSKLSDGYNMKLNQENYSHEYQVNDFEVAKYGAKGYSGKIIFNDGKEFCTSTMLKQRKFWRSPPPQTSKT